MFEVFTIIITIQSLFSDDLKLWLLPSMVDNLYNILVMLNILMFIFEVSVNSVGKKEYFLSFYFFTDIIATITLFFDFGWIFELITGTRNYSANSPSEIYSMAKDGDNIRIGTKSGAITRIIRLVKLLRIIKLYKHIHKV